MDRRQHCAKSPTLLYTMGNTIAFSLIIHYWHRLCNVRFIVNIANIIIDMSRECLNLEMNTTKYMTKEDQIHGTGRTQINAHFNFFNDNIECIFDGGLRICIILNKALITANSCCFFVEVSVYSSKYCHMLWRHQVENNHWAEIEYRNVLMLHHNDIKQVIPNEITNHQIKKK
eukprot:15261_1